jgi:hypothetical protein
MKRGIAIVVACTLRLGATAHAQILTGSVIGVVKDESGALLPGVTVTITSPASLPGGPMTATTSEKGEYRFGLLPPGSYALNAALDGFATYKEEDLRVAVGSTTERDITLKIGNVAETITVSGQSPMVDPQNVSTRTTMPQEVLEVLPNHRYYFTEYVKWSPGVSASDPTSPGQTDLSVMGSTTDENTFLYDGTEADRPNGGGPFSSSDHDAVEEIGVITVGPSAEYQLAQGAVVNVIYKSGTNDFRAYGSGFWFPDSLTSKPFLLPCNCPLGKTGFTSVLFRNYSGHVSGPIVKDKLWFFGGGVYSVRIQVPPGTDPNQIKTTWYSDKTFAKVTWQMNDRLHFRAHYATDPYGGQATPTVSRPFNTLTANYGLVQVFSSELTDAISSKTLLTIRGTGFFALNYPNKPLTGDTTDSIHTDLLTGIACCGVATFNNQGISRYGQSAKLDRFIQGGHVNQDVRFGVQFEEADYHSFTALPGGVNYLDLNGAPDEATFRSPAVNGAQYRSQGLWGEDQLTIANRLTLSLGLRYDRMRAISPPEPAVNNHLAPTDGTVAGLGDLFTWNVVSPRLGFNLKLSNTGKTILRGNYGRSYRQIFLNDWLNIHPGNSPTTLAQWNPATAGYTTIISVTNPLSNIGFAPGVKPPYTNQYAIGIDREVAPNLAVGVSYVHKDGADRLGWVDTGGIYGTQMVTLSNGQTLTVNPLLNSTGARKFVWTNGPGFFTRYNGLLVSLTKRLSRRWQANMSYTYSRAEGLIGGNLGTSTSGQDPNAYINAAGLLPTDRPHMFAATSSYEVPRIDLVIAGNFMSLTGTPYARQALISLAQGRTTINIAPPDGTYRFPAENILSIRADKILFRKRHRRLDAGLELMNALQNEGVTSLVSQIYNASTFGQAASWVEPRRLQLVLRVQF